MVTLVDVIQYMYPNIVLSPTSRVQIGDNGSGLYIAKWDSSLGHQPTQAQLDAAIPAVEAAKAKQTQLDQMAMLESSITARMLREAILDKTEVNPKTGKTAKQQIADIDAQIVALRAKL